MSKTSDRKDAKDKYPQWRLKLLAVPAKERCPTQGELIRALDLSDSLLEQLVGKPAPAPGSPEANRAILAVLETFYYRFKHNYTHSILNEDWDKILDPILDIMQASIFIQDDMTDLHKPTLSASTLHIAVRNTWQVAKLVSHPSKTGVAPHILTFLLETIGVTRAILTELQQKNGDALLKQEGSWLTISQLTNISTVMQTIFILELNHGKRVQSHITDAVQRYFDILLSEDEPCWYTFGSYCSIYPRTQQIRGLPSVADDVVRVMKRYLAFAEAEKDPFRIAWCAYDVGEWVTEGPYVEFEALLEKGNQAEKICKTWMPSFYRKSAFVNKKGLEKKLEDARKRWPRTYRSQVIEESEAERAMERMMIYAPIEDALKKCASCGVESRGLNCCSAVSSLEKSVLVFSILLLLNFKLIDVFCLHFFFFQIAVQKGFLLQ